MQDCLEYMENENYYLVNKIIKIDSKSVPQISCKRNLKNLIKKNNLWYYKKEILLEILFNIENYEAINFKNNDDNDYRFDNLNIIYKVKYHFNKPENVEIIEYGEPKLILEGKCAGQYKNMYWKVKDSNNCKYYIIYINDNISTKISIEDLDKILNFEDIRPTWGISNDYIKTNIRIDDKPTVIYLHQYIMDVHFEDNTSMKKTVDHINRDKLDNRRENLRFANMSEQNSNRDKQKRQKNACELPEGIKQTDLPIYVCYNKRCYNKENDSWREFFTIENYPNLDKPWATSKSNNVTIKDKLAQATLKIKHLNNEITDKEYKKIVEPEYKLLKGLRLSIDKKYNKYKFEYEDRSVKPCINYKMVLIHNDLQLMIDRFIDLLNDKYKDNKEYTKKSYYKLEKHVLLDFSSVANEIIDDTPTETDTDTSTPISKDKYKDKPDLPDNFSLYQEKDYWCLGFGKTINKSKYAKRFFMQCMCIQTELDRLIEIINKEFPCLNIEKYTVKNPYDFIDKTQKENNKPKLPANFCVCNIKNIDYIQFSKKIDDKKLSYKKVIKSNDLQKELDTFVNYLNQEYKLNLTEQKVVELNDWKTTNKIK
jgi:hypothetical protein